MSLTIMVYRHCFQRVASRREVAKMGNSNGEIEFFTLRFSFIPWLESKEGWFGWDWVGILSLYLLNCEWDY